MRVIRHIEKFNPCFSKQLEEEMLLREPKLPKSERILLEHLFSGDVPKEILDEHLPIIINAMGAVTDYTVTANGVDVPGYQVPTRVFRWYRQDIIADRFGYLLSLGLKLSR